MAVSGFIEGWYNPHRRHSGLDYMFPSTMRGDTMIIALRDDTNLSTKTGQLQSIKQYFKYHDALRINMFVDIYNIEIEFSASDFKDKRQFYSNLADAIIDAFKKEGVRP